MPALKMRLAYFQTFSIAQRFFHSIYNNPRYRVLSRGMPSWHERPNGGFMVRWGEPWDAIPLHYMHDVR